MVLLLLVSLEDTYEALSVFDILAIEKKPDVSSTACQKVLETLEKSSPLKDVLYALKVNGKLKCSVNEKVLKVPLCCFHCFVCCSLNIIAYETSFEISQVSRFILVFVLSCKEYRFKT